MIQEFFPITHQQFSHQFDLLFGPLPLNPKQDRSNIQFLLQKDKIAETLIIGYENPLLTKGTSYIVFVKRKSKKE